MKSNPVMIPIKVTPTFANQIIQSLFLTIQDQKDLIETMQEKFTEIAADVTPSKTVVVKNTKTGSGRKSGSRKGSVTWTKRQYGQNLRYCPQYVRERANRLLSQHGFKAAVEYVQSWRAKAQGGKS